MIRLPLLARRQLLTWFLGLACAGLTQAQGVTDNSIVLGQNLTLQAGKNSYGVAAAQGMKLYIDQAKLSERLKLPAGETPETAAPIVIWDLGLGAAANAKGCAEGDRTRRQGHLYRPPLPLWPRRHGPAGRHQSP